MGDSTKFQWTTEYYAFHVLLLLLVISEVYIFCYTHSGVEKNKNTDKDLGTKWLLYINFTICIIISFLCVSQRAPVFIKKVMLPQFFTEIGLLFMIGGVCVRIGAVLTLKKAFTLNVQVRKEQKLVTYDMYKIVRHPAYTGSICSLLGISMALRNIFATVIVFLLSLICYQIRITVEEKVLIKNFEKYQSYKEHTYKLFPYIY